MVVLKVCVKNLETCDVRTHPDPNNQVEGMLYKVHRYLLEHHSEFFCGFLSDDGDAMGHSDDRPISLPENVTQEAFDCLMSFLYTGCVSLSFHRQLAALLHTTDIG